MPAITIDRRRKRVLAVLMLGVVALTPAAWAGQALVAVSSNFAEVMQELEAVFEQESEHELTLVAGSTGKLYAQISHGAPFDLFLAADQERPRLIEEAGLAVDDTRFTYAVGRLVLWSPAADHIAQDGAAVLRRADFRKLAMANPALAPYGAAARETLEKLGLYERLRERIVVGENVGQAYAMVATGNAELGFVAMSQVVSPRHRVSGSRWDVPPEYYAAIRQDAVLLRRAANNAAAAALLGWLQTDEARTIIERFGYGVE